MVYIQILLEKRLKCWCSPILILTCYLLYIQRSDPDRNDLKGRIWTRIRNESFLINNTTVCPVWKSHNCKLFYLTGQWSASKKSAMHMMQQPNYIREACCDRVASPLVTAPYSWGVNSGQDKTWCAIYNWKWKTLGVRSSTIHDLFSFILFSVSWIFI